MHPLYQCLQDLEKAQHWRTTVLDRNNQEQIGNSYVINAVSIKQMEDGFVSVERVHGQEHFLMKTSPSNGSTYFKSSFLHVTASMTESDRVDRQNDELSQKGHLFVKSNDRRLHYNGKTGSLVVRNAGHSAGFDDNCQLTLW